MWSFALLLVSCLVFPSEARTDDEQEKKCYRQNEVLECVKVCPPERTCRNRGIFFNCLQDNESCQPKCVCKKGFYRNPRGDCISDQQCDMCQGAHEYYACSGACDNVCATLHEQNQTSCPIVNFKCNEMCYCEEGHARDADNVCVPFEQCPETTAVSGRYKRYASEGNCGPNEVFNPCKKSCPPETCMSLVAKYRCQGDQPCEARCACKSGFLRKKHGTPCVPIRECPELANSPDFN